MESLTKENFWNDLHAKYPSTVDDFCKWIDEYKKEVDWSSLFNERTINAPVNGFSPIEIVAPKFHNLPIDMQLGILFRYVGEKQGGLTGQAHFHNIRNIITHFLKEQHEQI